MIVSLIAFFELCFTGSAERSMRLARSTDNLSKYAGVAMANNTPRRRTLTNGAGDFNSPSSAPLLSRKVSIGKYGAMLIFLVFCISAIVLCPDGQSFHQLDLEGGISEGIAIQASASGTGKEAPSSRGERAVVIG